MEALKTEIVVLGAGPGGYAAAFYAADLGKKVILVERDKRLGGVCLNRGCIPSKALLHAAHTITAARESEHRGIVFNPPTVDPARLRAWKESVVAKLAGGVAQLAKMRGVQVMYGRGYFEDSKTLRVETEQGQQFINYDHAIVAVGSRSALPKAFDLGNPRVMTSREALEVEEIDGQQREELYDRVLVAVGRVPNAGDLGLENTKVSFDDKGFIHVNEKQQTTDPAIYAIGDIAGGVLLAHKASKEARIGVEVIVGEESAFTGVIIPAVVFTDPEL